MIALVVSGLSTVSTTALSQSKKKQWCCTLGSKVASFKSQGEKSFGKIRNICLDSKSRPSNPRSIYVKKCKRVSGVWRVTPEISQIRIVANSADDAARNKKNKVKKKTKSWADSAATASAGKKSKAKKKRVASKATKKKTKSKAKAKVAKKARGKSGAKPKKARKKKVKKTKKTSKTSDASN